MRDNLSKTLLIMRHAKSSWNEANQADHDRPLNRRGERDAPRMAAWLKQMDSVPQVILSSTAKRAITTANVIADQSGFEGDLLEYQQLYMGVPDDYLRLLGRLPDDIDIAMVVGHNNGLEHLVEKLTSEWTTMPTAAIAKIDMKIDRWLTVGNVEQGKLLEVWRPKEIEDGQN